MAERQDPRTDPVDIPPAPHEHVRGEDAYPGAASEPTMGFVVSQDSRVHHTDGSAPDRPRPLVWALLLLLVLAVVVALVVVVV